MQRPRGGAELREGKGRRRGQQAVGAAGTGWVLMVSLAPTPTGHEGHQKLAAWPSQVRKGRGAEPRTSRAL